MWASHPEEEYLDEHNGRFCVTPEYPNGIYCYFATVDANLNSAYPYVVGPTYYGNVVATKVTSITETTTPYEATAEITEFDIENLAISIFPNPASDLIAIQVDGLLKDDLKVELIDLSGRIVKETIIHKGSTIAYFDVSTVYNGTYLITISNLNGSRSSKVIIK